MKPTKHERFGPTGKLILSPMLGPWDRYETGSEQWAQAVALHIQYNYRRLRYEGSLRYLVPALREAVATDPPPWEVYPEEAKGNPEAWMRMVTGETWTDVQAAVCRIDPEAWGPIAEHLQRWEADHRNPGAPKGNQNAAKDKQKTNVGDTYVCSDWDATEARGIRRRLQKRADAGDELAAHLVDQLAARAITVNQAAIEAGMRHQYIRVRSDDPEAIAAALKRHLSPEQLVQLAEALLA